MRVAWLTENYFPSKGGMSVSCDRIITGLRKALIDVHVYHFTSKQESFSETQLISGVYFTLPKSLDASHDINLAWNFIERKNKQFRYDILVVFGSHRVQMAGPIFSKWLNLPMVTCIRGNDFDANLFHPSKSAYLLRLLNDSAAICSVSEFKAKKIRQLLPASKVYYTPNGIDVDEWQPLDHDFQALKKLKEQINPGRKKIIGLFGFLKKKKGMDILLNAIKKSKLEEDIHLVFSKTNDGMFELVLEEEHGLSTSALEPIDRFGLIPYYMLCDLIIIPSHYEGMPNVLLEAGALKKPVIAADRDGMLDVLNEENGSLFEVGNADHLSEVLLSSIRSKSLVLEQKGEALYKSIIKHHTLEIETQNYIQIFKSVLK